MKTQWKRLFLWSSLASLAVGATLAVTRRTRKNAESPLVCRDIPPECERLVAWTERFQEEQDGREQLAHDEYLFQPTPFRVWSVLDLGAERDSQSRRGTAIYHVTHRRLGEIPDGTESSEIELISERYYGTLDVVDTQGRTCGPNRIARGGTLVIKKCYVGGTSNGVETGEIHHSLAPILNYRFDYVTQKNTG
jgi:hypothetical protein